MSDFTHLVIVLPCHSMEDFPTHYVGADAENLLAYWTSLWHPALINSAKRMPQWQSADFCEPSWRGNECVWDAAYQSDLETESSERTSDTNTDPASKSTTSIFPLVIVPRVSDPIISTDLLMLADQDGVLITEPNDRSQVVADALHKSAAAAGINEKIDPDLAEDFFALGYAFLQVQMMTRQLRYSSNLNEREFEDAVIAAATASVGSRDDDKKRQDAKDLLTTCFDLLLEEKNAYYPVEPQLCDIVLTANSTLGKSLTQELEQIRSPINLLITGETAKTLRMKSPQLLAKIQTLAQASAIENNEDENESGAKISRKGFNGEPQVEPPSGPMITLVGGLEHELPDWLLNNEAIKNQLRLGVESMEDVFQTRPTIFMRRTFGVSPALPGILGSSEFNGAIHATLGQGTFPQSLNGVIRWTGFDEASILAMADRPINATDAGSFLGLGIKIGEMIDSAHMASVLFVRWPNQRCQALDDLRRINDYCSLFGSFTGLNEYFASLYDPGFGESYQADEYRINYLKVAIDAKQSDPISRYSRFHQRHAKIEACRRLVTLSIDFEKQLSTDETTKLKSHLDEADRLQSETESAVLLVDESQNAKLDEAIESLWNACEGRFASEANFTLTTQANPNTATTRVLVNLLSAKQVSHVRFDANRDTPLGTLKPKLTPNESEGAPTTQRPSVPLADQSASTCNWIVETPAMGHVLIDPKSVESANHFKGTPPIAAESTLQNEFFIAGFDRETGGIRNLNFHNQRKNLFTQQLAIRTPSDPGDSMRSQARYSTMVADSIEVTESTSLTGTIRSTGRLIDGDETLCLYVQTVSIVRGIARLNFQIELEPIVKFLPNPNHYLCSRLAWKDESSRIVANSIDTTQSVASEWIHATRFVTVGDDASFTLLSDGLPYHRRSNRRMLDTVLLAAGETQTRFQFSIDINQPYGLAAAASRLMPPLPFATSESESKARPWLLHFDCRNVLASRIEPLFEGERLAGLRLRLQETEGRPAKLKIRCPHRFKSGNQVYFNGDSSRFAGVIRSLDVDERGRVEVELGRFAFAEFNLYFNL